MNFFAASLSKIIAGGGGLSDPTPVGGSPYGAYAPALAAKISLGTTHTKDSYCTPADCRGRVRILGAIATRLRLTSTHSVTRRVFEGAFGASGDGSEQAREEYVFYTTTLADVLYQGAVPHSASVGRFGIHLPGHLARLSDTKRLLTRDF
jgi:hypothetical protein